MTHESETGASSQTSGDRSGPQSGSGRVSFLDQALWKQLQETTAPDVFLQAWLALQCRLVPGCQYGVVVLGEPDDGPFAPAAFWPDDASVSPELSAVAELALSERRGVVQGEGGESSDSEPRDNGVAWPLVIDGSLYGVVAVHVNGPVSGQLRSIMRQLQWGAAWIEILMRRRSADDEKNQLDATTTALDLVAIALEQKGFKAACNAVATELATQLDCNQVSIGFLRRGRVRVTALSHSAQFGRKMNLVRAIGAAMDEAIDQECIVLYPPSDVGDYYVMREHEELARTFETGPILTVPVEAGGRFIGAMTFELPHHAGFGQANIELCDGVASMAGPLLEEKRRNDRIILTKIAESLWIQVKRLFGPHYVVRKLAVVALACVVAFFAFAKGQYRVTSPAILEGMIQRSIVAPFDGYVASERVRAGETVEKGAVLATLDDKDLVLERLRWTTTRSQHQTEYSRALAERDRAEVNIVRAQIEQADAQIALIDEQIVRTRLIAPFDGLLVMGDLSQSIGGAVQRGEELFKIAPLNLYRVILEVDETDVASIAEGQGGALLVSSIPDQPFPYVVEMITPVAAASEGRNYFRVEARLEAGGDRLRPGMEGVAKTDVDRRHLIWIWSRNVITWLRISLWTWWP
jgi:multidrug resistance efflux pump